MAVQPQNHDLFDLVQLIENRLPKPRLKKHKPNNIPEGQRIFFILLSGVLLVYGTLGILHDDLYIRLPRTRRSILHDASPGTHLQGVAAWMMYCAMLLAVISMVSVIVDHYDKRDNEINYKRFARRTLLGAWGIASLAFLFG
jgi:hypothetical protein